MPADVPVPDEVEDGVPRLVVHDGVPYCVVRSSGATRAFVAACAHKDRALVPLRMKKGLIVCPHHGATFSPDTGHVVDARGYDIPHGLVEADVRTDADGAPKVRARRRHRRLLSKKERRRVAKAMTSPNE